MSSELVINMSETTAVEVTHESADDSGSESSAESVETETAVNAALAESAEDDAEEAARDAEEAARDAESAEHEAEESAEDAEEAAEQAEQAAETAVVAATITLEAFQELQEEVRLMPARLAEVMSAREHESETVEETTPKPQGIFGGKTLHEWWYGK